MLPCSARLWHLEERTRAMEIWCEAEGAVPIHPPLVYKESRLLCRPLPPTASQQQLLPQPGCHLLFSRERMPLPSGTTTTIPHAQRLNDPFLLHSNPNLDDSRIIDTSRSLSRQRHLSSAFSRTANYDYLRSNSRQMSSLLKTPPSAWKYAFKLKYHQYKAKLFSHVQKTQRNQLRKSKSSPAVVVQPQVVQVPTTGHKTVHVPKSKHGSLKHKTVHVPKI
jgi:hypothetical protein